MKGAVEPYMEAPRLSKYDTMQAYIIKLVRISCRSRYSVSREVLKPVT
jgi:hypothetical protein